MWDHLKFSCEAPYWTAANWIALKWTMRSQTKACIAKSSEVCSLVRYYVALSGNSTLTFQNKLSVPASRVKKFKRENRAWGKLTDFFLGGGPLFIVQIVKEAGHFGSQFCFFFFRQRSIELGGSLRLGYSQSLGTTITVIKIYTWKQI